MPLTSAVIGTAKDLSAEQAQGKPADARSDVYALGCVLYEAVTGHAPFEGETPFAVAYQHVQEEPTAPSESLNPDSMTPTERVNLDAVVLTSMAKDPADRYQSAQEFGADLERMSSGTVTRAAQMHIADDEPSAHSQPEDSTRLAAMHPATTTMDPQPAAGATRTPSESDAVTGAALRHISDDEPSAHSQPEDSTRFAAMHPATATMDPQPAAGAAAGVPVAAPGVESEPHEENDDQNQARPW